MLIAFIISNCSKTRELAANRTRMMQPSEMKSFHPEISITVGWMPYQDQQLIRTGRNEWKIIKHQEGDREGSVPVILVSYPGSRDSVLLDMNIENELLGKLIKHSAMTQMPIERPFNTYFEEARCQNCHPENVKVDFGK